VMEKTYREKNLGVQALVGQKILAAFINDDKNAMALKTESGDFYLKWEGDCCAQCFIAHINGAENLIGSTILAAEDTEWVQIENEYEYEVSETMGTKFKTDKGYVDIETRVEHNGHYSGMVNVSRSGYIDAYSCFENVDGVDRPLSDF
jgi:hypothetical protein